MAISKINVGNTSHPLKDGLLHTVLDKDDWQINNLFSTADPGYDDPLTEFSEEQLENILSWNYSKALPLGTTIQLPQTTFTHEGTTYTEGAKTWMYCGNAGNREMIFMRYGDSSDNLYDCEVTKANDPSIAIARHLSNFQTSATDYTNGTAAFKSKMKYLESAVKAQFEAFLAGQDAQVVFRNQIPTPVAARQHGNRVSSPSNSNPTQLMQSYYVSSVNDDTLNFTQEKYRIALATSSNFFGRPVLSQMIAPLGPKASGAAQNEGASAVDAAIYQYGGPNFWAHEQFPIFKSETGGNVINAMADAYSHLIFDERRRNCKKLGTGNTFFFCEDFPGIDSDTNITLESPQFSGNGVFAIYTVVYITEPD